MKIYGPGQHLRFVTLVILDLSLNMLIFYMTTTLLKIAINLNLYKLLLLDLLLVQKTHISLIFIQRAGVDDFRNKKDNL